MRNYTSIILHRHGKFLIPNLVEPCVHAIVGKARIQCAVRVPVVPQGDDMGVAEEDFKGAFGLGRDLSTLGQLYDDVGATCPYH